VKSKLKISLRFEVSVVVRFKTSSGFWHHVALW